MTLSQPSGTMNLLLCLETIQDVCAQLLGDPEDAIDSIRRSGILAAAAAAAVLTNLLDEINSAPTLPERILKSA